MTKRLKIVFWLFFFLFVPVLYGIGISGRELFSSYSFEVQGANLADIIETKIPWTRIGKVDECRTLLKNSVPLKFEEKNGKIFRKQAALCILDLSTGDIVEKRYWISQADIDKANNLRRNYRENPDNLPVFVPADPGEAWLVINNWWNNWNSDWSIGINGEVQENLAVAADKFLVPNSYIAYPEELTGPKYSEIVYAPYSLAIHNDEIVRIGAAYVVEKVNYALADLRSLQVQSRAFPGKLVADTVRPKFVREILVDEQTDPDALLNKAATDEEKRKVAERVLVRYAINGDKTFRYTVSKTGASGMAQIMPTTYTSPRRGTGIVQRYPEANLIKDVELGRLDPINAVKTEILVFDDHMVEVANRVANSGSKAKKIFENLSEDQLDEVRAMIYNGGASKYNTATGTFKKIAPGIKETKQFVEKLRVIRYLDLFKDI